LRSQRFLAGLTLPNQKHDTRVFESLRDLALDVGAIDDVSVSYDPTRGELRDDAVADALCVAALLTFRPKLSPAAARRIYGTAMRRAANATATGRGGIGRSFDCSGPGSFMVEAEQLNIRCMMAARDQRGDI
jgi:hypothetical protein